MADAPQTPPVTVVDEIAAHLGETEQEVIRQLRRAVRLLGEERVRGLVTQALEVEAAGGMMVPDDSRRRTVGGVFFHLARTELGHKEFYRVFRPQGQSRGHHGHRGQEKETATALPVAIGEPFDEATFDAAAIEAMSEAGEATTKPRRIILDV